jgi:OmcA/MtrC family decaheme c-type cytochrome
MHGGTRPDARFCTTCHTAQRAYGRTDVASDATGAFPAITETFEVDANGWKTYEYEPALFVGDGEVLGHFTTMVHKIHNGNNLSKKNYNYESVVFDMKAYSMLDNGQRMCTVCHSSDAPKAELAYSKPSIKACGSCHDNVNFKTGKNHGEAQLARPDDSSCTLCHESAANKVAHRTVNLTTHNPAVTDGLVSFTYDIKDVKVDAATNDATIEFAIFKQTAPSTDKTAVTFVDPTTALVKVVRSDGSTVDSCLVDPLDGFSGAPGLLLAFAVPQDGITAPADYNNLGNGLGQSQPRSI